jgi:hypothetical protein
MLVMVVEKFRSGTPTEVGERFRSHGRLIPSESGVEFVTSWMAADGSGCYQLMKTPSLEALDGWLSAWSDLVEFEIVQVVPSAQFWQS